MTGTAEAELGSTVTGSHPMHVALVGDWGKHTQRSTGTESSHRSQAVSQQQGVWLVTSFTRGLHIWGGAQSPQLYLYNKLTFNSLSFVCASEYDSQEATTSGKFPFVLTLLDAASWKLYQVTSYSRPLLLYQGTQFSLLCLHRLRPTTLQSSFLFLKCIFNWNNLLVFKLFVSTRPVCPPSGGSYSETRTSHLKFSRNLWANLPSMVFYFLFLKSNLTLN